MKHLDVGGNVEPLLSGELGRGSPKARQHERECRLPLRRQEVGGHIEHDQAARLERDRMAQRNIREHATVEVEVTVGEGHRWKDPGDGGGGTQDIDRRALAPPAQAAGGRRCGPHMDRNQRVTQIRHRHVLLEQFPESFAGI